MPEENTIYLSTNPENSEAETIIKEVEEILEGMDPDSLTDEQKIAFAKVLGNYSRSFQILGGTQIQIIGQNQFILEKEAFRGVIGEVVEVLVKHLGQDAATEVMKEMINAVVRNI